MYRNEKFECKAQVNVNYTDIKDRGQISITTVDSYIWQVNHQRTMSKIFILLAILVAVAVAEEYKSFDYYAYPKYEFKYGVEDPHTHDKKERAEHRDGHMVKQEYAWGEKDREVKLHKLDDHDSEIKVEIKKHY